ncbi:hypothetical protein OM076_13465 [Solirubrobacter ginsenosidimutans]|uniref:Uncharacterized protein n=1 Tax=Solirubrobacter ginsenosidimutans TaxID=490573 RepID=A0A9X3RZT8_9ACTN|nr:hypothetical protein [Solirubrobacter ginsenosidimutans]MDA0161280.1 hypothetical protein [Solirubrobacter ginsenosidimutans]
MRFLQVSRTGVTPGPAVGLDSGVSACAAVATSASGAGVVACCQGADLLGGLAHLLHQRVGAGRAEQFDRRGDDVLRNTRRRPADKADGQILERTAAPARRQRGQRDGRRGRDRQRVGGESRDQREHQHHDDRRQHDYVECRHGDARLRWRARLMLRRGHGRHDPMPKA